MTTPALAPEALAPDGPMLATNKDQRAAPVASKERTEHACLGNGRLAGRIRGRRGGLRPCLGDTQQDAEEGERAHGAKPTWVVVANVHDIYRRLDMHDERGLLGDSATRLIQ
jgi:hypothetical protein